MVRLSFNTMSMIDRASRFWRSVGLFACGFTVLSFIVGSHAGHFAASVANLPRFLGLALPICAVPAGMNVTTHWPGVTDGSWRRNVIDTVISGLVLGAIAFLMTDQISTAALVSMERNKPVAAAAASDYKRRTSLQLLDQLDRRTPSMSTGDTSIAMSRANEMRWEINHRLALIVLSPLLTLVGLMAGLWIGAIPRSDIRRLSFWAITLITVMVVYHNVEIGHEAAAHAPDPLAFAGVEDTLFVPLLAVLLLGFPTAIAGMGYGPRGQVD